MIWEIDGKVAEPCKYFQIVPNEHIQTIMHIPLNLIADRNETNSYTDILKLCKSDRLFKHNILSYIDQMIFDALNFASTNYFTDSALVKTDKPYYEYMQNIKEGSLFMVVHYYDNSQNHMHIHCYVSGSDAFQNSQSMGAKSGPFADLFFNTDPVNLKQLTSPRHSIAMSIDYFRNLIEKAQ